MTYTNRLAKKEWDERASTLVGAMSAILDRYDGDIETFYESGEKHVNDMMIALGSVGVDSSRFKRVVDVGCGIGRLSVHFADRFESVWATDISQEMIDKARRKGNISYVCTGSLTVLPPFFDAVLSHIVFQHMSKEQFWRYLDESWEILKKGGIFCTQMHETEYPYEPDGTILVRGYTKQELEDEIDQSKWEILGLLHPAGESEIWKWLILRKR